AAGGRARAPPPRSPRRARPLRGAAREGPAAATACPQAARPAPRRTRRRCARDPPGPGTGSRRGWSSRRGARPTASPPRPRHGTIRLHARQPPGYGTLSGVGTRILTVEDDERIRTAVKMALEDE